MTKKLCTSVGCRVIVEHNDDGTSPRCPEHSREYKAIPKEEHQRKYEHHYDENGRNIYRTTRWRKLRAVKVGLNPICEHCEEFGIAKPVEEVDHIIEIEDGGAIWDIDNLQSLCKRCHIIKTNKCKAERNKKVDDFGYFV